MKFELIKLDNNQLSFKILEQEPYLTIYGVRSDFTLFNTIVSVESCDYPDILLDGGGLCIFIRGSDTNRDDNMIIKSFRTEIERDFVYDLIIISIKHHIIKVKKENNI